MFIGAGGKGGSSPDVADISGISSDRAEVVLGICEGQVEGLGANPAENIFLDGTPIEQGGTRNFEGLDFAFFSGGLNQGVLPGNSGNEIATPTNVGVLITQATPINRAINNPELNAIRVRVAVRLQRQENDGDIRGNSLRVQISVKEGAGAFVLRINQEISGRFPDFTVFTYLLPVNPAESDYTVRVVKQGDDSSGNTLRDLQWLTYEEVIQAQLSYPNTATLWIQYPPRLFRSAPQVTLRLSGLLVQLPVTSTVAPDRGLNFSNVGWNGNFYKAGLANTCPVWLLWAYMTDKIWGLGIPANNIDRYAFYQASLYCNELIGDGFGTTERRFAFRGQINVGGDSDDRFATAREIAASFAAKIYHNGLQYTLWQDRPSAAIPRIVSNADVVDGTFLGTTQDFSKIATACYVWRADPDQEFEETPEPVEYPSAINRYGFRPEEFKALGETRRGGAVRAGRRVIISSLPSPTDGEIGQLSFKVRAFGLFFELGEVVQIADSARNPTRKSGLVKTATTTQITLDAATSVQSGAQIFAVLPNLTVEQRTITQSNGTYSTVNITPPLSQAPLPQSTWQIVDSSTIVKKYRVINVTPDIDNQNLYEVVCKQYREASYNEIENGWLLTAYGQQDSAPSVIPPPRNVNAQILAIDVSGYLGFTLVATWDFPVKLDGSRETYVVSYFAEFKRGINGEWGNRQEISNSPVRWENIGAGDFYVRLSAISATAKTSQWVESSVASATNQQGLNFAVAENSGLLAPLILDFELG